MKKQLALLAALFFSLGASVVCGAQSGKTTSARLDLDFRVRLSPMAKPYTELYNGTLLLNSRLAPGVHLNMMGMRKYGGNVFAQQAALEKDFGAHRVQAGILRLPFGIYDYRETYVSGLIDYAMPRVDYGMNSVDWGVPGVQWTGGTSQLQAEVALFEGRSAGVWNNANDVGGSALRLQTHAKDVIFGASHWNGYFDTTFGQKRRNSVHLSGFDVRYTRSHLVMRGEYLFGVLGGKQMHGWYLDTYYRLPQCEKVTLALRLEALKPGMQLPTGKQVTLGVRYTLNPEWTFVVNWRRNNGSNFYSRSWTPYAGKGGDVYFQVYRKVNF